MKKNQLVFIIGGGLIGAIGMCSTWYAGRKSYKMGVAAGYEQATRINDLKEMTNKQVEFEQLIAEFEYIINSSEKES